MVKKLFRYKLKLKKGGFREGLILQLGDRFGEIAPLPKFSKETLEEAEKETIQWMDQGSRPTLPSVRFGIACAKKTLNSVSIPLCALGVKQGFSMTKLKLGHLSVTDAITLVKKTEGHLRLDFNRAWSLSEIISFTSHFNPSDFAYLEEPTYDLLEFAKITKFPIALDESIHLDWSKIPTLKAIVVKPTVVGSIPKVPSHLDLVLSSSYESGLGLLHIANQFSGHLPIGLDTADAFEEDLLIHPIRTESGIFSWEKREPILDLSKLCRVH